MEKCGGINCIPLSLCSEDKFQIIKKMFHWQLTSFRAFFDSYGTLLRCSSLGRVWRPAKVVPGNRHWRRYGVVFPSRAL